jgi:hypothetical protein
LPMMPISASTIYNAIEFISERHSFRQKKRQKEKLFISQALSLSLSTYRRHG